jgi:hypothetical protein
MQDNKPLTSDPHDTLTAPPKKAAYIPPYVTQLSPTNHTANKVVFYVRETSDWGPS